MALQKYREKRRFDRTPEPKGRAPSHSGPLRFVAQKHAASRLHYDLRLEAGGVLKSWAVPKGPSMNPTDKRLAMMVEDHPLDYRTFEGTIPAGNYGAGTVMVWDEGRYTVPPFTDREAAEKAVLEGLEKGKLKLVLDGQKLRGGFMLVKSRYGHSKNSWLLVKERDPFATEADIRSEDRSVRSDRSMDQIAQGTAVGKSSRATKSKPTTRKIDLADAPPAPMPHRIRPMLATPAREPFDRAGWLFEVKWDGYRAIAEVHGEKVQLYSRRQNSLAKDYPAVVEALRRLGHDAVLDGEVVVLDERGVSDFHALQGYRATPNDRLAYYVFDLLYLDGHDLRRLPLSRRKQLLKEILPLASVLRYSEHFEKEGVLFFEAARAQRCEGIVAKRADSPYQEGKRPATWLKIKAHRLERAVIGGFTRPKGSRVGLGSLLLGQYDADKLHYVGHVGTGFDDAELKKLHAMLTVLAQPDCPFDHQPATNAPATWTAPRLMCDVSFQEKTPDGHLRHPVYQGLVSGAAPKSAGSKGPEHKRPIRNGRQPHPAPPAHAPRGHSAVTTRDGIRVPLTNGAKVYWPEEGYTKGDVVAYYREVVPFLLPHLKDRPLSLLRHPNGIDAASFFQKDVSGQPPPEWVETAKIASEGKRAEITYAVCQNEATLLYLANLGCIELNPWGSRLGSLERPDYFYFDLDPVDTPFERVVEVALTVRRLLENVGAACFCKTSGKRGLHVYVPLAARYDYAQVKPFARLLAALVHRELPETTSTVRLPSRRQGRVYLDVVQNGRGKTLACAYSVRPWPGATVSTPLKWSEVGPPLDPARYTIQTLPKRLAQVGDLWAPVRGAGANLASCLDKLRTLLKTKK
jgi:bifunctional non-homologous end joining protein LigD